MNPKKRTVRKAKVPHFEYFSTSLKNIVLAWSHNFMVKKDWEILAIDEARDTVVFRRFQHPELKD